MSNVLIPLRSHHETRPRAIRSITTLVLLLVAALTVSVATLMVPIGPAQASASHFNTNPYTTGCAKTASTIASKTVAGGTVYIKASSACGTNWVEYRGTTQKTTKTGKDHTTNTWTRTEVDTAAASWSMQSYAPGTTAYTGKIVIGSTTTIASCSWGCAWRTTTATGLTPKSTACPNLIVLGARGSSEPMGSGAVYGFGEKLSGPAKNMVSRVQRTGTYRFASIPYAAASATSPSYFTSVKEGASLAASIVNSLATRCTTSRLAVLGYSQGAELWRLAMPKMSSAARSKIILVGLVGDPKRRGYNLTTPEVGYQQNFGTGPLYGSGLRGAGTPYTAYLSTASSKVATFCARGDYICNRPTATTPTLGSWWSNAYHTTFYQERPSTIGYGLYTRLAANGFR